MNQEDLTTLIQEASKYAYVKDGLVYLKAYLDFPDRKIGEVKESEESSIKYFVDRFEIAKRKVNELSRAIEEAQNKGSYLMKLIHLKEYLGKFDAIGNYIELFERLDEEEVKLQEIIAQNKVKNLEIKKALIEEARQLLTSEDWDDVSEKFKELRTKWIKTGNAVKEENDALEQEFKDIIETFFTRRKEFFEERNRKIIEEVNKCNDLYKAAEALLREEKTPENIRKMKSIQQEWKALGQLPKQKKKQMNNSFKIVTSRYFNALKPNGGGGDRGGIDPSLKVWDNLANQAEEISANFSNDSLRKIKAIQSQWQALGQINKKKRGAFALIEKFRTSVSKVYEYEFLNKTALRRFGLFFRKPEAEQLKLKISLMTELIKQANAELKTMEDSLMSVGSKDPETSKMLSSKQNAQKRKVEIMHLILDELNQKLDKIR